jgi:hypothetical protein
MFEAIGLAIALLLAGCGSSTEIAVERSSTVTGSVVQVNPVLFVDELANAPEGAQPVDGAEVKAFDVSGTEVATVTTDANGSFSIPSVDAGYLRLEVRLDPASTDPDATTAVTAYPDAVIPVNGTYTVSRQDAIDLAMATVDQDALVTATLQPLQAGTVVVPSGSPPGTAVGPDAAKARTAPADEWMFFVEEDPYGDFANPCRYIFVDAETGAVTTVEDVFWPPLVNDSVLWGSLLTMFMVEGMDLADPSNRDPDAVATPTEEVVQLPTLTATVPAPTVQQSQLQKHNTDPQSIFAIVWQCKPEPYAAADMKRMLDFLTQAGVPVESNIKVIRSLQTGRVNDFNNSAYTQALNALNALIDARLQQGLHSTLVVYVTAHAGGAAFSEYYDEKGSSRLSIFPSMLKLTSTKACRVRVFLECCYARHFADDLAAEFDALPAGSRHDYAIYAACARDEYSYSIPAIWEIVNWATGSEVLPPAGGRFTTELMKHAAVTGGDITGLLDSTGAMIRPELTSIFGTVDFIFGNVFFHPSAIIKPAEPAWCLAGEESFVSIPEENVSFLHIVGSSPCPQTAGTFQIQNTGSGSVTFNVSSSNSAIDVAPAGGSLPPGGSITVTVLFNCSTQTSFNASIDVTASDITGGGEDSASIPVQATISN